MAALTEGPVAVARVAQVIGRSADVADRVVNGLVADGLCVRHGDALRLP
jgi:predicted transcriptional regulator